MTKNVGGGVGVECVGGGGEAFVLFQTNYQVSN